MLSYKELEDIARLKRLSIVNSEKDYLQDLVLFSIYSKISRELVFKGGTCMYKIYKLKRFSEDLDFTMTKRVDIKKLADGITNDLSLLNINCRVKEIQTYRNEINVRLLFNGPLYKGSRETQCFIPLNISLKENLLLEPQKEGIVPMCREIPNFDAFAMQEKEIMAEKVRAVFTRAKPRDVYDLHFLALKKNMAFDSSLVNAKLALYNMKFSSEGFAQRLEKVKGLWNTDLKNLLPSEPGEFGKIREELIIWAKC